MMYFRPLWMIERELHYNHLDDEEQLSPLLNDKKLYLLLQNIKTHLSQVPQNPSNRLKMSFLPLKDALISPFLLFHYSEHIKITLASCLSEVFRVSAPEDPYSDEWMKQCLRLMVSSLDGLHDTLSRSYEDKLRIFEVMKKGHLFNLILDLECEDYILDLFDWLLKVAESSSCSPIVLSMISFFLGGIIEWSEPHLVESFVPLLFHSCYTCINRTTQGLIEDLIDFCACQLQMFLLQLENFHVEKQQESIQVEETKNDKIFEVNKQEIGESLLVVQQQEKEILYVDQKQYKEHEDKGLKVTQDEQIEQEVSIVNQQFEEDLPIVQVQQDYIKSNDIDLVSNLQDDAIDVALPIIQQIKVNNEVYDVISLVDRVQPKDYMFYIDAELEIEKLHPIINMLLDKEYKLKLKVKIHHHKKVLPLFCFILLFILHFKTRGRVFSNWGRMKKERK